MGRGVVRVGLAAALVVVTVGAVVVSGPLVMGGVVGITPGLNVRGADDISLAVSALRSRRDFFVIYITPCIGHRPKYTSRCPTGQTWAHALQHPPPKGFQFGDAQHPRQRQEHQPARSDAAEHDGRRPECPV